MSLAKKLNLAPGTKVRVVGAPRGVDLGTSRSAPPRRRRSWSSLKTSADVDGKCRSLIEAAKADRIAWAAYPKAGKLGTDLNRDVLWKRLAEVRRPGRAPGRTRRDVWSAMRLWPRAR